jgi:hypothetical protein
MVRTVARPIHRIPVLEITLELTYDKEANTEFKSLFKLRDWV